MSDAQPRHVRLRTAATDKKKALEHYQQLRRSGRVRRAVVITEDHDGEFTILGQMLKPAEIARMLVIAAEALAEIEAKQKEPRLEAHQEPERRGEHNRAEPRHREVTIDADGMMVPPPGENLLSCGECSHPRFYVFHFNDTDQTSRYACAHCGNEVKSFRIDHPEGHA